MRNHIAFVFQEHLLLAESIRDNLLLANRKASEKEILDALEAAGCMGFISRLQDGIDTVLGRAGSTLSLGQQQRLCIARGLVRQTKILILDEPTGVLTPQEVDELFKILRSLKEEGKTIVLITHKLNEIMDLTSEVSVMRQGEMVGHKKTESTNKEDLAEMMVGRSVLLRINKSATKPGNAVFSVRDLVVKDDLDVTRVKNVNLDIHEGEILGLAGVIGNGQTELLEALSGIRKIESGEIQLFNETISKVVNELNTQKTPLGKRDTYGKAFLQIFNLWKLRTPEV